MPVFDAVLGASAQTRQRLYQPLRVPDLDALRVQSGLHPLADQPAGHRVGIAPDVNRTASVHADPKPLARLQPPRRQRLQQRQLLGQSRPPARIQLLEQTTQERRIVHPAPEVPTAAQQ